MAGKKGESRVRIFQAWCKGCGICVTFCPNQVLDLDTQGKAYVVQEDECINCGFCEIHCPDFAIMVHPREELTPFEAHLEEVGPVTWEDLEKSRRNN